MALGMVLRACAGADELVWPDPAALAEASHPNVATKQIDLGKDVSINAQFELTEKGNGGLTIPGYGLRVYDAERDGVTYKDYLLRCEWRDTNADGYLDLVASGTAQFWSKAGDRVEIEKTITAVFSYDPATRAFVMVQCPPEVFLWRNRATAVATP